MFYEKDNPLFFDYRFPLFMFLPPGKSDHKRQGPGQMGTKTPLGKKNCPGYVDQQDRPVL